MKITVKGEKWSKNDVEALIVPIQEKENLPKGLPKLAEQMYKNAVNRKDFSGKAKEILQFSLPVNEKKGLRFVVFIGLGKSGQLSNQALGRLVGQAIRSAQLIKAVSVGFYLRNVLVDRLETPQIATEIVANYASLAGYEFNEFVKVKKPQIKSLVIYVENSNVLSEVKKGAKIAGLMADKIDESRDLANRPSNEMTPKHLADFVKEVASKEKLKVTVLGEKEMKKEKMGALLGVARGSAQEAQFIIVEYWGGDKKEQPFVVVGKGITFDSGGISIKPSPQMEEMKFDMSGAAAALAIVRTIAALQLKINVIALMPASENMPGHNAYKPGDILTAKDGSTIEVINTDAEGRLLLADALIYARKYQPKTVIDLATLTGACVMALHDSASGMFTKDSQLAQSFKVASDRTGDPAWQLPLPEDYKELLKSNAADITNLANTRWGGAITAAVFLEHFVGDNFPWVHFDIAGTAWIMQENKFLAPGATGAGIRLVVDWLRNQ